MNESVYDSIEDFRNMFIKIKEVLKIDLKESRMGDKSDKRLKMCFYGNISGGDDIRSEVLGRHNGAGDMFKITNAMWQTNVRNKSKDLFESLTGEAISSSIRQYLPRGSVLLTQKLQSSINTVITAKDLKVEESKLSEEKRQAILSRDRLYSLMAVTTLEDEDFIAESFDDSSKFNDAKVLTPRVFKIFTDDVLDAKITVEIRNLNTQIAEVEELKRDLLGLTIKNASEIISSEDDKNIVGRLKKFGWKDFRKTTSFDSVVEYIKALIEKLGKERGQKKIVSKIKSTSGLAGDELDNIKCFVSNSADLNTRQDIRESRIMATCELPVLAKLLEIRIKELEDKAISLEQAELSYNSCRKLVDMELARGEIDEADARLIKALIDDVERTKFNGIKLDKAEERLSEFEKRALKGMRDTRDRISIGLVNAQGHKVAQGRKIKGRKRIYDFLPSGVRHVSSAPVLSQSLY